MSCSIGINFDFRCVCNIQEIKAPKCLTELEKFCIKNKVPYKDLGVITFGYGSFYGYVINHLDVFSTTPLITFEDLRINLEKVGYQIDFIFKK